MDSETLAVVVLMPLAGLFSCYLGYRIRYRRDLWLISGYRPGTADDEAGLARFVGGITLVLGVVTGLYGPLSVFVQPRLWYWTSYVAVMLLGVIVVQIFGRRYA